MDPEGAMQVVIELPEDIGLAFAAGSVLPGRAALEGLAAEGYRSGVLTEQQLKRLLGLENRFAVHRWLEERNVPLQYTQEDLAGDLNALREAGLR